MCIENPLKNLGTSKETVEERILTAISLFGIVKVVELVSERLNELNGLEIEIQKEVFKEFLERHKNILK